MTDTFQELLTEQLESASAPNLVQANLYIRQAEAVGLNDAIVGWLRNYRDQVVRIGQLEGELKLAKSAAREAWGEVRRCREIATPDLFEDKREFEDRAEIVDALAGGIFYREPFLSALQVASLSELDASLEKIFSDNHGCLTYGDPEEYGLAIAVNRIVAVHEMRSEGRPVVKASPGMREFVSAARSFARLFHPIFTDSVEDYLPDNNHEAISAIYGFLSLTILNDITDDQIGRIEALRACLDPDATVPDEVGKLFAWIDKYRQQEERAREDAERIDGVLEDLTAADGFPRPEDMCGFLADKWEELMPMARGTVTEMVFNRDSENEATVYREGNVFELSLFSPAGWATGKYRTRSLDEIAVILSTHEIWSAGPMRSRALGEKLLSSVTEGGLTGALSPESVESLWGMVHPAVYTTTKAGKRKLKKRPKGARRP